MKRQSIYFIAILASLLFLLSSCAAPKASTTSSTTSTKINNTNTTAPIETNLSAPDITVWYRQNYFDDVIGPDLPAGDYVLVAFECGKKGKYELFNYSEDSESKGSLIEGSEFDACVKVTLKRGQILFSENLIIYKAEDLAPTKNEDGIYLSGLYEVGQDMPAGSYLIKTYRGMSKSWTHLAVMSDLDNKEDSLSSQTQVDPFGSMTVAFNEGQFVFMRNVYATGN